MAGPTLYNMGTAAPDQIAALRVEVQRLQSALAEKKKQRNGLLAQAGGLPMSLTVPQRKLYEEYNAQIATLQSQLDTLASNAYQPASGQADWESAIASMRDSNVAAGNAPGAENRQYTLGAEALRQLSTGGGYALPEATRTAIETTLSQAQTARQAQEQSSLPEWAKPSSPASPTGGLGGTEDPNAEPGGSALDLTDPMQLVTLGVPVAVILAMQGGDENALPRWIASQTDPNVGVSADEQERIRLQNEGLALANRGAEWDLLTPDRNAGVIGGVGAADRYSQAWLNDYMNDPGAEGQLARAYIAQQTGQATPWERQQWQAAQDQWAQSFAADEAYRSRSLAQQQAYQQAVLEQQRREMAAQIGQAVANMANQSYMDTLGYRLPAGTEYAPGFQPGGSLSALAGMSGIGYTPSKIAVANPPTSGELMDIVRNAIGQF